MTLDRMNYLYKKGLYSPINYYLGLLAILKDGADLGVVMGRVPETLLETILVLAARHRKSEDRTTDSEENTMTGNILAWGKSRSLATKLRSKASPPGPQSINRLRIALNFTVEEFALQLDVSPWIVASWERGERAPSKAVQAKLDALEAFLKKPRTGRRVASGGGGQGRASTHRGGRARVAARWPRTFPRSDGVKMGSKHRDRCISPPKKTGMGRIPVAGWRPKSVSKQWARGMAVMTVVMKV